VLAFAAAHEMSARDLRAVHVIVPAWPQASCLRSALQRQIAAAFVPPRIAVWPMAFTGDEPPLGRQAELFAALRGNVWVRESFSAQPAALWSLARGIAQLCDELTWAAAASADGEADFEKFSEQLQASLARHFHRRAARVLQPQRNWCCNCGARARSVDDGAVRALRELMARADANRAPAGVRAERLLDRSLGQLLDHRLDQSADRNLRGWERTLLLRLALHAPVLLIEPDAAFAAATQPLLAAPARGRRRRYRGPNCRAGRQAARRHRAAGHHRCQLARRRSDAAAHQVLQWHRGGVQSIALVALDRLTARPRAPCWSAHRCWSADETGWKLSTTSAAAAVMRWFDLVADDLYWRDLLDWLKSPFTLADRAGKANEIAAFEQAVRATGALQGARAFHRPCGGRRRKRRNRGTCRCPRGTRADRAQLHLARRAGARLAAHARALHSALVALGMRAALARDPVGASVLRELDTLESELAAVAGRASLADSARCWRNGSSRSRSLIRASARRS